MAVDYTRKRRKADRQIKKWGGPAKLRRSVDGQPVDRDCYAAVIQFRPDRFSGRMFNGTERQALVSALSPDGTVLDPPPNAEKDQLVLLNKNTMAEVAVLRFVQPPEEIAPDSTTVVLWDMTVSR